MRSQRSTHVGTLVLIYELTNPAILTHTSKKYARASLQPKKHVRRMKSLLECVVRDKRALRQFLGLYFTRNVFVYVSFVMIYGYFFCKPNLWLSWLIDIYKEFNTSWYGHLKGRDQFSHWNCHETDNVIYQRQSVNQETIFNQETTTINLGQPLST